MKIFITCLILPFILAVSAWPNLKNDEVIDYRLAANYRNRSSSPYACEAVGLACSNCRDRVVCVQGSAGLEEQYLESCPKEQICVDGECIKPPPNPPCSPLDDIPFECENVGVYPDPGNCKKYHMCCPPDSGSGKPTHHEVTCEGPAEEYGYNAKTTFCDRKLRNRKCTGYPVPMCKEIYKTSALSTNPVIYYQCMPIAPAQPERPTILYPKQYRCDNGKRYSNFAKKCA